MKPYILRSLRIVACGLVLFLSACGKDDDNTVQPPATPQEETLAGNKEKPDWQIPSEQDLTASMTAVVRVNLRYRYRVNLSCRSNATVRAAIAQVVTECATDKRFKGISVFGDNDPSD